MIVYCPKCKKEDVEVTLLNPPKAKRISIDELPGTVSSVPAVMIFRRYQAKCRQCGYTREYTQ